MRVLGVVEVKVVVPDRPTDWIRAVAVSVGREEVLLSDKLTDALGVSPVLVGGWHLEVRGRAPSCGAEERGARALARGLRAYRAREGQTRASTSGLLRALRSLFSCALRARLMGRG